MIQTTTWKPDTCDCVIDYTWDDTTSNEERIHTFSQMKNSCDSHKHLAHPDLYDQVLKENQTKNKVLGHIQDTLTKAELLTKPEDFQPLPGEPNSVLSKVVHMGQPLWSFDDNRQINIHWTSSDPNEVTHITALKPAIQKTIQSAYHPIQVTII